MFTPDIGLQVVTRCSKFRVTDTTGVDTGDGDKWSGVSGLDPSTVTEATIEIVGPDGVGVEYDVTTELPSPAVTGTFTFADLTGTNQDGLHNLIYRLKTSDFAITAYSDYSTTVDGTTLVTAAAHGLVTSMYVDITGSTSYDGEYYVTRVSASQFYIAKEFVADDGASTGTAEYLGSFYPYVYCEAEANVQKLYANISNMVSCPSSERTRYIEDANTAWGLLQALKSAISSANTTAMNSIQSELTQIFNFYDTDANL